MLIVKRVTFKTMVRKALWKASNFFYKRSCSILYFEFQNKASKREKILVKIINTCIFAPSNFNNQKFKTFKMGLKKQFLKSKPVCKVTFSLPKEAVTGAKEVKVLGEFNDWDWTKGVPMKTKNGSYTAVVELPAGKSYQFRYKADNNVWENDWAADNYVPSPFDGVDNSVVIVSETVAPASVAKKAVKRTVAKKTTAKKSPAKKVTKKTTTVDKLTMIEGIGPKIEGLLKADGINTFAKLSKASKTKLQSILKAAGSRYQMHDPSTWAKQAKLAANNEWTKLEKWQKELKGGK